MAVRRHLVVGFAFGEQTGTGSLRAAVHDGSVLEEDDFFVEGNEETFAWDHASLSEDGRAVTLSGIHAPPWWSPESSWWSFDRAEIDETEMAVSLLLWMRQRRPREVGARQVTDPDQRITVPLPTPLAGRVVIDGNARLVAPTGERGRSSEPQPWDRVVRADDRTLVVYWVGWNRPHDTVEVEPRDKQLVLTVWQRAGGRASGHYWAAIVHLDEPAGDRTILDGAPPRR
jgi:hypothetical protein